jgi:hypothetical protein
MSTRFVKKQLSNLAAETSQSAPVQNKPSKKALKRKQKSKAKAVKAAAASDPNQVFQKNLAYFKSTKGAQEETATLMSKVRVAKQLSLAGHNSCDEHQHADKAFICSSWARQQRRTTLQTISTSDLKGSLSLHSHTNANALCCRCIYISLRAALWDAHSVYGTPWQAGPH